MKVTAIPWPRKNPVKGQWLVYGAAKLPGGRKVRSRKVVHIPTHAQAIKWGEANLAFILTEPAVKKRRVPTVEEFSKIWVTERLEKQLDQLKRKPSSINAMLSCLGSHLLPFVSDVPLDELGLRQIEGLFATWSAGGYEDINGKIAKPATGKTQANRLTVLTSMLNCAIDYREIDKMPFKVPKDLQPRSEKKPRGYLEVDTYERLVDGAAKAGPEQLAVVLLAGEAGLRLGDVRGLRWEDVDFSLMKITAAVCLYTGPGGVIEEVTPKGGKTAVLSMTNRLADALRALRATQEPQKRVLTYKGKDCRTTTIHDWIGQAESAAGLTVTKRCHVLRHTLLTHAAQAGVPMVEISTLARHADVSTTENYVHQDKEAGGSEGFAKVAEFRRAARILIPR